MKPHGLSAQIQKRFPHGNIYSARRKKSANTAQEPDIPGTVIITEYPGQPTLLHMMAQWTPGKSGTYVKYYPRTYQDTVSNRRKWFAECLEVLQQTVPKGAIVAMPYYIGCGMAGGDWKKYMDIPMFS